MTQPAPVDAPIGLLSSLERNLLIMGCALLVTTFFALQAWKDYQSVQKRLLVDAERAVVLASDEIEHYLQTQQRLLRVFTRDQRPRIEALANAPADESTRQAVQAKVNEYFPDAFAFSLIDPEGRERVVDFDGLIGDLCRDNISELTHTGEPQPLMIHPHPEGYHFDVMTPWRISQGVREIFFISFRLTRLARILELNENLGFGLYVLRMDAPGLIEVSSRGSRLELSRPDHLDRHEMAGIRARHALPESRWELVAVPDADALSIMTGGIVGGLVRTLAILWLVAVGLALLLNHKEHQLAQRRASEAALRERNCELYERATHDRLTGLANRHLLEDGLDHALKSCAREHLPLSVAMIDVDHFKSYNDGFGHQAGDECLRRLAAIFQQSCRRPDDLVGRYGGEEFLLILPGADLDTAEAMVELARSRVEALCLSHPRGGRVTFSAGIACVVPDHSPELHYQLVSAADTALYRAKHAGRDHIETIDLGVTAQHGLKS